MSTADAVVPDAAPEYVLRFSCEDEVGIVYAISKFLVEHDCNIVESQQFGSRTSGLFFMRVQFSACDGGILDLDGVRREFVPIAERFGMGWDLRELTTKQRVLIMVSKYGHCLDDLLFRAHSGWLNVDVVAVVSNHPDMQHLTESYDVPYFHIPVTAETKAEAEAELLDLVDKYDVDLVVLARYMQILSDGLCEQLAGRAINIHHSMLPAFKGARPYHQARDRGVKLVGATAHYVTADLDEGPIIEQEVARIDHTMTADQVTQVGRDNECIALARAVRWHTESRVIIGGKRTVVFK
ncbi:formyltetrahydrofolate deformylase [Nocardioides sp. KR10-350]|uniref:formyltetrahydrofolate deformylase n=1 Tax=Nocardioides cheoyonin TaxID=3156615 RepID=UPI0032B3B1BA